MTAPLLGLHHVTAIAGDAQQNIDFYSGVLGLRLVKLTVNFDDPGTYHFYYGDELGRPGTIMTFFAWPGARRGRAGTGQIVTTAFSIPAGSTPYWTDRLRRRSIPFEGPNKRDGEEVLALFDADGLALELVANQNANAQPAWASGPVPREHAIRGIYGVTMSVAGYAKTAELLTGSLGFRLDSEVGGLSRFGLGTGEAAVRLDVLDQPEAPPGEIAVGTVHHVAWRVADSPTQQDWRQRLIGLGLNVTPVMNRNYFESIYFREPSGVLFEIATDQPGFTVDEPANALGSSLMLPAWLEPMRSQIESVVPPVQLPDFAQER